MQKLATSEYADELVVLAVTLELPVRVVVIPHTPAFALRALPAMARRGAKGTESVSRYFVSQCSVAPASGSCDDHVLCGSQLVSDVPGVAKMQVL